MRRIPKELKSAVRDYKDVCRRFVRCKSETEFDVIFTETLEMLGEVEDAAHERVLAVILAYAQARDMLSLIRLSRSAQ